MEDGRQKAVLGLLAAAVWYTGSVVLLLKGGSLLLEAEEQRPDDYWHLLAIIAAVLLGAAKGITLFTRACRKNLERIAALEHPRLWQFYRPRFFLLLVSMITLGATLSRMASYDYWFLISVAILDISIAVALLGSSHVFWTRRTPGKA